MLGLLLVFGIQRTGADDGTLRPAYLPGLHSLPLPLEALASWLGPASVLLLPIACTPCGLLNRIVPLAHVLCPPPVGAARMAIAIGTPVLAPWIERNWVSAGVNAVGYVIRKNTSVDGARYS